MFTRNQFALSAVTLLALAVSSPSAEAGFNPIKAIKKEANKAARTGKKEVNKATKPINKIGRDLEGAANDVAGALKDLNLQVSPYGRTRIQQNRLLLTVGANVSVAGQRFSVNLFNGYVKKTRKSFKVARTVKVGKSKMKITLDISWSGNHILIRPKAKVGKLPVPMPSIRVKA